MKLCLLTNIPIFFGSRDFTQDLTVVSLFTFGIPVGMRVGIPGICPQVRPSPMPTVSGKKRSFKNDIIGACGFFFLSARVCVCPVSRARCSRGQKTPWIRPVYLSQRQLSRLWGSTALPVEKSRLRTISLARGNS